MTSSRNRSRRRRERKKRKREMSYRGKYKRKKMYTNKILRKTGTRLVSRKQLRGLNENGEL